MLFGINRSEHTILDCYVVGNHVRVRVRVFVSVFQYSMSVVQVLIAADQVGAVRNHVCVRVCVFVSVFQYSLSVIQVLIVRLLLVELSKSHDAPHVCWR